MPRFFVPSTNIDDKTVKITAPDAVHIGRSLRMRLGDDITVCCQAVEYYCNILTISDDEVVCRIVSKKRCESEPNIDLTLFQAIPKGDKLDMIVQKAVELGAGRICPVLTARCVSRPDKKSFDKKLERLNRIALEAAKQSGRGIIPRVSELLSFDQAASELGKCDFPLICYEGGGINLSQAGLKENSSIGVFIGSEGGFDPREVEICTQNGAAAVGLGRRYSDQHYYEPYRKHLKTAYKTIKFKKTYTICKK